MLQKNSINSMLIVYNWTVNNKMCVYIFWKYITVEVSQVRTVLNADCWAKNIILLYTTTGFTPSLLNDHHQASDWKWS